MIFIRLIIILLFLGTGSGPILAQDAASYSQALQSLNEINRIPPLQNPNLKDEGEILSRHVLDRTNRIIGEVEDVILTKSGAVETLSVDFDRLRLRGGSIGLNYADMAIRPASNGYIIGFEAVQIEDMYPQILAGIETASGEDAERRSVSVKAIIGAPVRNEKGRKIGAVKHVLFGENGNQAQALFIAMFLGGVGAKDIAVPFNAGKLDLRGTSPEILVSDEQADAMNDFVRQKR